MRSGVGRTRFVEFSSACSFHNFPKRFRVSSNSPCRDPDTDPTTMRSRAHQERRHFPPLSNCCLVQLNGYDRRGLKGLRRKEPGNAQHTPYQTARPGCLQIVYVYCEDKHLPCHCGAHNPWLIESDVEEPRWPLSVGNSVHLKR